MQKYKVKVRLFAELKEIIGEPIISIELDNTINLTDFLEVLARQNNTFVKVKDNINKKYKLFVNGVLTENLNYKIAAKDEVAILPPVGGG